MSNSCRLEEFRQLPEFKKLTTFLRKSLINIGNVYPNTLFGSYKNDPHYLICKDLVDFVKIINFGFFSDVETVKQDETLCKLLQKLMVYEKCLTYNLKDTFQIKQFTLRESNQKPNFLYHCSNTNPDIIMKKGLLPHYSLGIKCHPPLVFVSADRAIWQGDFVYKIKIKENKKLYIDTNLDYQCRDKKGYLCLIDKIEPIEIIDFEIRNK